MKELSTEEMNSVRGGQDTNVATLIANTNTAAAANVSDVAQTNAAAVAAGFIQNNSADVDQRIRQNLGNVIQRA
jgi:hypothetical protein